MLRSLTKKFFSLDSGQNEAEDGSNMRKDDYLLIVCQRNDLKKLEIQEIEAELASLLGYSMHNQEELKGRSFKEILPDHTNELIDDYLEYDGDGNDLSSVLGKVRDFSLVAKNRKTVPLSLRILPTTSQDNNPRFCLILRQASLQKVLDAGRDEIYRALRKSIIAGDIGALPQRETLVKDLEAVISYLKKSKSTASMAVVAIRDLSDIEMKYGTGAAEKTLQEIALICKSCLREDDIIARLSANKLAAVLLEANLESSMTPLNRLRWKINAHEIDYNDAKFKAITGIGCTEVTANDTPDALLDRCERAINGDAVPGVTVLG